MKRNDDVYEKTKSKLGEKYAEYKYYLDEHDLEISKEFLRLAAEYGKFLTQPLISDEEYKDMLFNLSLQIKQKEYSSPHKENTCISRFFDEEVTSWYCWMFDYFKFLIENDEEWKSWFLEYMQADFIIKK